MSPDEDESDYYYPHREVIYNQLLPYHEKLEDESKNLFKEIKTNLIKAFIAREIRPGCLLWTSRLNKYLQIYGLKFSKEDHIGLIKLYYELVTLPNLEPTRIGKFACTLTLLLKKKQLLSRDDLQLEWRPLYNMVKRITHKKHSGRGRYRYVSNLETSLDNLMKVAKIYYPANATQDILNEIRPMMCPYSYFDISRAMSFLEWFLPVKVKSSEAHISYELWFEEFMTLWESCHNCTVWENSMAWIMATLSIGNIGQINWDPYVPGMFARFLRALHLPVGFKHKQASKSHKIEISAMTQWIVGALGGPSDIVFVHLEQLMQVIESYLNTANSGRWSPKLRDFIKKISLFFISRVSAERFRKGTWMEEIPDSHKLTDADIDRFINIVKPSMEHIIYSRHHDVFLTFNYLASIRPNMIIPMLIDKLYLAMDSLTEPHKLTSAMMSVSAVARYMVQGKALDYPDGPTHVVPLLMNLLPGIDANDIRKCYMTFNFILQVVNVVPLINSSEASVYYDDLTEEEHIVCESTATFEDFVLQFFDRLCTWVESNSLESTRMEQNDHDRRKSKAENQAEGALASVISAVLTQCSPEIYSSALKKMFNFATSRIFEVRVSGRMVGCICQLFAKINPKETAKLFIPHLCDVIDNLLSVEGIEKEETLDEELLYNLLLLSEVVDANVELPNYMNRLVNIMDKTLFLTSLQGGTFGAHMLNMMMMSLSFIQPLEQKSSNKPYDLPVKENLSVREWGKAGDINKLNIKWYTPGEKEVECLQMLLNRYLIPQLQKLEQYASGELMFTRETLRQTFRIVSAALGCHTLLPLWKEPAINIVDSVLDPWEFELSVGNDYILTMPDGSNVRKCIADTIHRVQRRLLDTDEGDTKSIFFVISIYDTLLFNSKFRGRDFELHWKSFQASKCFVEDQYRKNKKYLRFSLIERAILQQELRNASRTCSFTATHKQILVDLFQLSVSHYGHTRQVAQSKLLNAIVTFPYCYMVLKEDILEILKLDPTEHHEKFKGCLYLLLGQKSSPVITKHDWEFIRDIWPALLSSKPSEKLSIVNLIDALIESVHNYFPTISVHQDIPDRAIQTALNICKTGIEVKFDDEIKLVNMGISNLVDLNERRMKLYTETIAVILDTVNSGSLHWRYYRMGFSFIRDLFHPEVNYDTKVVNFFLKALIHETLQIRKLALTALVQVFNQTRRKFPKITFKPISSDMSKAIIKPGIRPDNKWLLYDSKNIPKSEEEWNNTKFVHDASIGFYCWSEEVEIYDITKEALDFESLTEQQLEIYQFFCDEHNLEMLIKYYSMEEKKGLDKFSSLRAIMYKNLFKLFEDKLLPLFLPQIEKLLNDKQEQSQRCLSELLAGILSGAKHWNYHQMKELSVILIPILKTAQSNLAEETLYDWGVSITASLNCRDPTKYSWLLEFLMDDPINEQTSYIGGARIYFLQCALMTQPWRNIELYSRLLEYLKPHLSHPFQYIRDKIGLCLAHLFCNDSFPSEYITSTTEYFFDYLRPYLKQLYKYSLLNSQVHHPSNGVVKADAVGQEDKENCVKLFKIVSKYVTISIVRTTFIMLPVYYELLPLACVMHNNETDEELATSCTNLIVTLSNAVLSENYMHNTLSIIEEIVQCPLWQTRAVIAEFLPPFVFHNVHILVSNQKFVQQVSSISLKLLEDVNPDVRERACELISGLLHCNFIADPIALLESFKKKAHLKLHKKEKSIQSNGIIIRHAGVLGLCSFIKSHPYDVPDFIPSIFEILGDHLNDPQPIPATIRKTLGDFKRTHHTNWEDHKLKFTENELLVLNDLQVPPSYYA